MARSIISVLKAQFPLGEQIRVAWAGTDWWQFATWQSWRRRTHVPAFR